MLVELPYSWGTTKGLAGETPSRRDFAGGRQTVGGEKMADLQSNRRIGATVVVPFGGRHAIKLGYSTGTRTRFGNDFDQFLVTYQTLLP